MIRHLVNIAQLLVLVACLTVIWILDPKVWNEETES